MEFWMANQPPAGGETLAMLKDKIAPFFEVVAENVKGRHAGGRNLELDLLARPKLDFAHY